MKIATAIRVTVFAGAASIVHVGICTGPAPQQPPAGNSKVNQRDQSPQQPTADQRRTRRMIARWRGRFIKLSSTTSLSRLTPITSKSS